MRKWTWLPWIVAPALALPAAAQINDNATDLDENGPSVNVRGGSIQNRAPGNAVRSAIGSHQSRNAARLAAQRSGDTSSLAVEDGGGSVGSGSGGGNALGGLLGGLLGGGSLGDLDLGGLLDSFGGGTGGTGGGSGTTLPPEVLDLLRQFGFDPDDLLAQLGSARSLDQQDNPLTAQTSDDPTTEEPKFVIRWANELLSSMFSGLTLAIATPQFRQFLQDQFQPLFPIPESSDDGDGATSQSADTADGDATPIDPNSASVRGPAGAASTA